MHERQKLVTRSEPTAAAISALIGALPQTPEFIALVFKAKSGTEPPHRLASKISRTALVALQQSHILSHEQKQS